MADDIDTTPPVQPFDIIISGYNTEIELYGLPQRIQFGWFYRKNNFSIYPNAGLFFTVDEEPKFGLSAGLALQKNSFTWFSDIFYDVVPFTLTDPLSEQIISFQNDFIFGFYGGSVELLNLVARKKLIPFGYDSIDYATIESVIDQGLGLNLFLLDKGFFRLNASALYTLKTVPDSQFFSYELDISVPATFSFYYFDVGLIYEFLQFDELHLGNTQEEYVVKKKWTKISGRSPIFPDDTRYRELHALELEVRWYFLREKKQNTSLFFSTFSQVGLGLNIDEAPTLRYEGGIGFGYVLLDVVPFTFQAGLNNNLSPVFKFSVVSKILHSS